MARTCGPAEESDYRACFRASRYEESPRYVFIDVFRRLYAVIAEVFCFACAHIHCLYTMSASGAQHETRSPRPRSPHSTGRDTHPQHHLPTSDGRGATTAGAERAGAEGGDAEERSGAVEEAQGTLRSLVEVLETGESNAGGMCLVYIHRMCKEG